MIAKTPRYENRALLDLAHRVNDCQIEVPEVCIGYSPDGCEPCHSNSSIHGKGAARKADDFWHAAGCHACHVEIDQGSRLTQEERQNYMDAGIRRTFRLYFVNGWLRVAR